MKETLIMVHPGYYLDNVGWDDDIEGKYGDYDNYLDRLYEATALSNECVILLYKKEHKLPFGVPADTKVLVDNFEDRTELIEMLKRKGVESIALGGEFLWWYGRNVGPEEIRELAKSLPEEKRIIVNNMLEDFEDLDFSKFEELGIDAKPFVDLFYSGTDAKEGCVENVKKDLEKYFPVRIIRELCYPIKEPGGYAT